MNGKLAHQPETKEVKMFSLKQVTGATIAGGIVAGSLLMTVNFQKKGLKQEALICGISGIVCMNLLILLGLAVPQLPALVIIAISTLWVRLWYKNVQYSLYKEHIKQGGHTENTSKVISFTFVAILINLVIIFAPIYVFQ